MDETAFFKLSYGLYIVSTEHEGKQAGCIVNTFSQVTNEPIQVSIALNKNNVTKQLIEKSGKFAVTVLTQDADMDLIGRFGFHSSQDTNKFEEISMDIDEQGLPYVKQAMAARFSCKLTQKLDLGTHVLLVGEAMIAEKMDETAVLTYSDYHVKRRGVTPPNASSYKKETKKIGWRCTVCGYIYEHEELPSDFICPICSVPASSFDKIV